MPTDPAVERWLAETDHPLKDAIARVREVVLEADARVGECIKWKSPTFTFQGNIASITPRTRRKVSLMFHRGAEIPGRHPRLVGGGDTVRYMEFADLAEVEAGRGALEGAIRAWCRMKES